MYKNFISFCIKYLQLTKLFRSLGEVKNFLFSSTAAVYKDGQYKVDENSVIKPKSVYGKTKLKCEKSIKAQDLTFYLDDDYLKYFNEWPHKYSTKELYMK